MHLARPAALALAAIATAATLTGCTGGSTPQAGPTPTQSVYSPPPCPAVTTHVKTVWPKWLPADLPKPPDATIIGEQTTSDGVHVVRFMTPTSLRDTVIFIVNSYPKAGYALGRGDAEATEADAPFVHGTVRGLTRVAFQQQCKTLWLTATVTQSTTTGPGGTSPLLSPHPTSSSTSPLPFG